LALVVAVHGIGQQFKADTVIHDEWWPSLRGGLRLAGGDLSDPNKLACAFYGNLFRQKNTLPAAPGRGPATLDDDEIALLEVLWEAAADAEPARVPGPAHYQTSPTMVATPQFVQRALNALSRSTFCSGIAQNMFVGDLKQVVRYFRDSDLRKNAISSVTNLISNETRVVIGHSLGSVVAYEALCRRASQVKSFVSIGSPLGMPNVIFNRLKPPPDLFGVGVWPPGISQWTNISDVGDLVANPKRLQPLFGGDLQDISVHNGSDAHHGERYLTAVECGMAIWRGLNCDGK